LHFNKTTLHYTLWTRCVGDITLTHYAEFHSLQFCDGKLLINFLALNVSWQSEGFIQTQDSSCREASRCSNSAGVLWSVLWICSKTCSTLCAGLLCRRVARNDKGLRTRPRQRFLFCAPRAFFDTMPKNVQSPVRRSSLTQDVRSHWARTKRKLRSSRLYDRHEFDRCRLNIDSSTFKRLLRGLALAVAYLLFGRTSFWPLCSPCGERQAWRSRSTADFRRSKARSALARSRKCCGPAVVHDSHPTWSWSARVTNAGQSERSPIAWGWDFYRSLSWLATRRLHLVCVEGFHAACSLFVDAPVSSTVSESTCQKQHHILKCFELPL